MVLSNQFLPNTIYSQTKLAAEMGISRTPVNSALQKLAVEGLLDIKPSKGFSLHVLTVEDVIVTYQMRCAVEGYCAMSLSRDLQNGVGMPAFQALHNLLEHQQIVNKTDEDPELLTALDMEFHSKLVDYAGNMLLSTLFHNQVFRVQALAKSSFKVMNRRYAAVNEHAQILNAIGQKDPYQAYEAVQNHMSMLKDTMIYMM
jgi:DNA-binding GntR family transcriptional regulator